MGDSPQALFSMGREEGTRELSAFPELIPPFVEYLFEKYNVVEPVTDCEEKNLKEILEWGLWLVSGGEEPHAFATRCRSQSSSTVCGHVWKVGDLAYRCRTCEANETCAICVDCFRNGNHEGHNYVKIRTYGGCCDCGDLEAWRPTGFCSNHQAPDDDWGDDTADELVGDRAKATVQIVLLMVKPLLRLLPPPEVPLKQIELPGTDSIQSLVAWLSYLLHYNPQLRRIVCNEVIEIPEMEKEQRSNILNRLLHSPPVHSWASPRHAGSVPAPSISAQPERSNMEVCVDHSFDANATTATTSAAAEAAGTPSPVRIDVTDTEMADGSADEASYTPPPDGRSSAPVDSGETSPTPHTHTSTPSKDSEMSEASSVEGSDDKGLGASLRKCDINQTPTGLSPAHKKKRVVKGGPGGSARGLRGGKARPKRALGKVTYSVSGHEYVGEVSKDGQTILYAGNKYDTTLEWIQSLDPQTRGSDYFTARREASSSDTESDTNVDDDEKNLFKK
eukprot:GFYU01006662.1.p1 GENE.GFYU01006662.1~~GFYU01006662.1.p1  ORF type:complete len:505 (-),score=75.05 GFYU01006662.1:208-1722(-)